MKRSVEKSDNRTSDEINTKLQRFSTQPSFAHKFCCQQMKVEISHFWC